MSADRPGNLVLTRAPGEAVYIGPDITVHVLEIQGGRVRLAITAPKSVPVVRDDAKVKESKRAPL